MRRPTVIQFEKLSLEQIFDQIISPIVMVERKIKPRAAHIVINAVAYLYTIRETLKNSKAIVANESTPWTDEHGAGLLNDLADYCLHPWCVTPYIKEFNKPPPQQIFDLAKIPVTKDSNDRYHYTYYRVTRTSKQMATATPPAASLFSSIERNESGL